MIIFIFPCFTPFAWLDLFTRVVGETEFESFGSDSPILYRFPKPLRSALRCADGLSNNIWPRDSFTPPPQSSPPLWDRYRKPGAALNAAGTRLVCGSVEGTVKVVPPNYHHQRRCGEPPNAFYLCNFVKWARSYIPAHILGGKFYILETADHDELPLAPRFSSQLSLLFVLFIVN